MSRLNEEFDALCGEMLEQELIAQYGTALEQHDAIARLKEIVAAPILNPLTRITSRIYKAAHASTAPSVNESVTVIILLSI